MSTANETEGARKCVLLASRQRFHPQLVQPWEADDPHVAVRFRARDEVLQTKSR